MLKKLKNRFVQFSMACIVAFAILGFQLAHLTVERGEELYIEAMNSKMVTVDLEGTRGKILDRNGIPLAANKQIYVVQLDRQSIPTKHQDINRILKRVLEIIDKNGDSHTVIDNIPLKLRRRRNSPSAPLEPYFIWEDEEADAQRKRYMRWAEDIGLEEELTPQETMEYLRERYKIDEDIPDEIARRIAGIRLDSYLKRYTQFVPVQVAVGVSQTTVAQLETYATEFPGIQTVVESGRYYPMGETAAHIIGYVGKISDRNIENYEKKYGQKISDAGYDLSRDRIGQTGVEAYAERWLTASLSEKKGRLVAEKDSTGRVVKVVEEILPQNGNDVILTLDSRLQRSTERILAEEINKMRQGLEPYDEAPLVKNGAAVILHIHTGEILAMASYPSFDLNLFPNGISNEKYAKLRDDPASPLYGIAFQGGMVPGSVFKMLVGIAGLMEGKITLDTVIYDNVRYTKYQEDGPRCWREVGHGGETLSDAIKHSCNYFFYEVADSVGIDAINKWAERYGLKTATGLEILPPESDYNVIASLEAKIKAERGNIALEIKSIMRNFECFGTELTEEQEEQLRQLVDFELSEDTSREAAFQDEAKIRDMLKGWGYFSDDRSATSLHTAAAQIRWVLADKKRWRPADTVIAGIGQSYTQISPLAIARYIAALVNGGKVLETHVVKSVISPTGETLSETTPTVINRLNVPDEYVEAIKEAMWRVIYDESSSPGFYDGTGTAVEYFRDMDPAITLGGKTGTAQVVAGKEERNNAWFTAFTPYEDPEVAVVVAIPNGRASGNAAPIARKIIEEYYKIKGESQTNPVQRVNELQQ